MSFSEIIGSLIRAIPNLIRLIFSLFWTYLTLGWRVRKAKRAFETQLRLEGMSETDARKLGACYDELKNSIVATIKQSIRLRP